MNLEGIFRDILEYNDYVSIPGYGSFGVRRVPSGLDLQTNSLSAPHSVYSFLPTRTFDDGAIAQHLQRYYDFTAERAQTRVREWLQGLSTRLSLGEKINFVGIGTLTMDRSVIIYTADALPFDSILLQPNFQLAKAQRASPSKEKKSKKKNSPNPKTQTTHGPRLRWILYLAVSLAFIVGAGYLLYTYVPAVQNFIHPPSSAETNTTEYTQDHSLELDAEKQKISKAIDSKTQREHALGVHSTQPIQNQQINSAENAQWVVVIGFFSNRIGAERVLQDRIQEGYQASMLPYGQGWRVLLGKFKTKPDAERVKRVYCTKMNNPSAAFVEETPSSGQ